MVCISEFDLLCVCVSPSLFIPRLSLLYLFIWWNCRRCHCGPRCRSTRRHCHWCRNEYVFSFSFRFHSNMKWCLLQLGDMCLTAHRHWYYSIVNVHTFPGCLNPDTLTLVTRLKELLMYTVAFSRPTRITISHLLNSKLQCCLHPLLRPFQFVRWVVRCSDAKSAKSLCNTRHRCHPMAHECHRLHWTGVYLVMGFHLLGYQSQRYYYQHLAVCAHVPLSIRKSNERRTWLNIHWKYSMFVLSYLCRLISPNFPSDAEQHTLTLTHAQRRDPFLVQKRK